jgi:hypothetical protein
MENVMPTDLEMRLATKPASRSSLIASYTYGQPYWVLISQADRDKAASSGAAMPDGSYPILSCEGANSVDSAINAVGRGSGSHNAIRKHIMTRAKSLGCSSKIPDNWNADGSLADAATAADGTVALATPPVVPPGEPSAPATATGPVDVDAEIAKAAAALQEAVAHIQDLQKTDPDVMTDPKDKAVTADIEAVAAAVAKLVEDQAGDTDDPDKTPAAEAGPAGPGKLAAPLAPAPAKPVPADGAPSSNPVNEDGDVENGVICTTPDCGHPAALHGNTEGGMNTGACTSTGCTCEGMTVCRTALARTTRTLTGRVSRTGRTWQAFHRVCRIRRRRRRRT